MVSRYGWSFQHQVPSLYVAIHPFFSGTAWHYNQMAHALPILAGVADILDRQQGQILTNMLVGESEVHPETKGRETGERNPAAVGWDRQDLFLGTSAQGYPPRSRSRCQHLSCQPMLSPFLSFKGQQRHATH